MGQLFFIKNLSEELESKVKLFPDDIPFFSLVTDQGECPIKLNRDLERIDVCANHLKMLLTLIPLSKCVSFSLSEARTSLCSCSLL